MIKLLTTRRAKTVYSSIANPSLSAKRRRLMCLQLSSWQLKYARLTDPIPTYVLFDPLLAPLDHAFVPAVHTSFKIANSDSVRQLLNNFVLARLGYTNYQRSKDHFEESLRQVWMKQINRQSCKHTMHHCMKIVARSL